MTDTCLDTCLACGGGNLSRYFEMPDQPLANAFHTSMVPLPAYPLGLQLCGDCFHSQNLVAVDPDLMFKDYPYVSGTSETLRRYFQHFVEEVEHDFSPSLAPLRVLEIASNDGTLLKLFKGYGHEAFGIDPAENLVPHYTGSGIAFRSGYFGAETVKAWQGAFAPFDVIVAMNVLGHVRDPAEFLRLCKSVLAPGGRIYVQTSQARMIENREFDTVYHEHLSFFTVRSFLALAARAGLEVDRISHAPVHGTSYLVELVQRRGGLKAQVPNDFEIGRNETLWAYYKPGLYAAFAISAAQVIDHAVSTVRQMAANGHMVVGYGAAAKGVTFLNTAGLRLGFIIDENPLKQGKMTPGGNIPVLSPEAGFAALAGVEKVCFAVLAWNFKAEIVTKLRIARGRDDTYLTFMPTVRVE